MCPTIVPLMRETKKEQDIYFTSLIETMKILVATEKPFAKKAVDGIRKIVEDAGYELALLEKYTDKGQPARVTTTWTLRRLRRGASW